MLIMRKIYFLLAFVLISISAWGADYFIIDRSGTNLLKVASEDNSGNVTYSDLQMTNYSGNLYYAIKEVIVTGQTLLEFQVKEDYVGSLYDKYYSYGDGDNSNGNAWVYLPGEGTYTLIFKYDSSDNKSLDVIQLANVVGEDAQIFGSSWNQDYEDNNSMSFNGDDNMFHLFLDVEIDAAKTIRYKVLTRHRTFEDKGKGWYPSENNATYSFTSPGKYSLDFSFNPITRADPQVTAERYQELDISSVGYASFSCPFATDVPSSVIAYYVTGYSGTQVTTEKTKKVPATTSTPQNGTGVIIEGDPGIHRFYETTGTVTLAGNLLAGTGSSSYMVSDNTTYVFAEKDGVVGFYLGAGTNDTERTYAAYKAYLPLASGSAREFYGLDFLNNGLQGINAIQEVEQAYRYYNLQGIRVEHPVRGLYIRDGKKVVVK